MAGVERRGRRRRVFSFAALAGVTISVASMTAFLSTGAIADEAPAAVDRYAWAMGTRLTVTVHADDRGTALNASEAGLRSVAEVEGRLSTWNPGSELSRLNAASPGLELAISPALESDLRAASRWWKETRGAFDPGIASLVEAWDLRGSGRQPSAAELRSARAAAGLGRLTLGSGTARRNATAFGVEEGGFGKGVALREAADAARAAGADCVVLNLGGQIEIAGDCGERWVDIADPRTREAVVARFSVGAGSVATSGNSERGLDVGGVCRGHLLDPKTGFPAPDWGAVTVLASDPVAADCLSTALFVMGPRKGAAWLQSRPEIEAVFVERGGETPKMTATPGLRGRLEVFEGSMSFLPPRRERIEEPGR